jgi:hypothetical protein
MAKEHTLEPAAFAALLADAGLDPATILHVDPSTFAESRGSTLRGSGDVFLGPIGTGLDLTAAANLYQKHVDPALGATGTVALFFKSPRTTAELARWRNQLWPWLHVVACYEIENGAIRRETLQGSSAVAGRAERDGFALIAKRREHEMSQIGRAHV